MRFLLMQDIKPIALGGEKDLSMEILYGFMKELLIALLIVAAVFLVSYFVGPTGYATYKFDKLTVSGAHPLLTPLTFSPNGDGVADFVSASASGKCGKGYGSGIGIYDSSGKLLASKTGFVCIATSCGYSGTLSWNGKDPSTGKAYIDGTYYVRSGCWPNGNPSAISNDKNVGIKLNSKAYPPKSTYTGTACGTKPKCKLQTGFGGWGTGCSITAVETGARCNSNEDTCLTYGAGSCKKNYGTLGNVVSCTPVTGAGVCQATAVAAVPGGK